MNTHNALKSIEPALSIDNREILISYCVDSENKQINARQNNGKSQQQDSGSVGGTAGAQGGTDQYTLADVPRLAEYSASLYAKTAAEQDYYHKYYTDYYTEQIKSGQFGNMPTMGETANSGAAVALSAIQRKHQKEYNQISQAQSSAAAAAAAAAATLQIPNGQDNRKYGECSSVCIEWKWFLWSWH